MDYLREGVHLRAMAQKDPLVEYRGEGHVMFEALGRAIREEVVLTLFHVELEQDESASLQQRQPEQQALSYEHETAAGADVIAGAAAGGVAAPLAPAGPPQQRTVVKERPGRRPQRSVLVRLGQEVQALPRRLRPSSAPRRIPSRDVRAST